MSKVKLIFFRFGSTGPLAKDFASLYEHNPKFEHSDMQQPEDAIKTFKESGSGIFIFKVTNKEDLQKSIAVLKSQRKLMRKGLFKSVALLPSINPKIEKILMKYGCKDIFDTKMNTKTISYKVEFWSKSIITQLEKLENEIAFRKKSKEAVLNGPVDSNKKEDFDWVTALDLESDIWLVKNKADCKKVLRRWLLKIKGPSTKIGSWEEVPAQPGDQQQIWKFVVDKTAYERFVPNEGAWFFYGSKPEFDWKQKIWTFTSDSPHLYFYEKSGEVYSRFKFKDGQVLIAKNSDVANLKQELIDETLEDEFTVVGGAEVGAGNMVGDGSTEDLGGELSGDSDGSTNNDGSGHYNGKGGKADSYGDDPLSGEGSKADEYGKDPLAGKVGTDEYGKDPLSGEGSKADEYGKYPLAGKAGTDEYGKDPLSGEGSKADEYGKYPLAGKAGTDEYGKDPLGGEGSKADEYGKDPLAGKVGTDEYGKDPLSGEGSKADEYGKDPISGVLGENHNPTPILNPTDPNVAGVIDNPLHQDVEVASERSLEDVIAAENSIDNAQNLEEENKVPNIIDNKPVDENRDEVNPNHQAINEELHAKSSDDAFEDISLAKPKTAFDLAREKRDDKRDAPVQSTRTSMDNGIKDTQANATGGIGRDDTNSLEHRDEKAKDMEDILGGGHTDGSVFDGENVDLEGMAVAPDEVEDEEIPNIEDVSLESGELKVVVNQKSESGNVVSVICEFNDFYEDELVVRSPNGALKEGDAVSASVILSYNGKNINVECDGKVIEVDENEGESTQILSIELNEVDLKKYETFMAIYQDRQESIIDFMKIAKGY